MVGREIELERILQALQEEQAHVVLYTERGRGKTSLANLVIETLRQNGVIVARHTCEAGSTFDGIVRGLLRDLPRSLLATPANDPAEVGCEAAVPPRDLRPRDVIAVMDRLTCRTLVCVVDEFDRVQDKDTRTRLADTIKQVSDQGIPLLFMVVGVSENLEQILGQHPSIQRNLVAVQLPLLSDAEVAVIIETGARLAGFKVTPPVAQNVAILARGSPYMAQFIGLRLVQSARKRGNADVSETDLANAVNRLLAEAAPHTLAFHASLTSGTTDAEMVRTLLALATANQDVWGRFAVMPSFRDGVAVGQNHLRAESWARILDAGVLRAVPERFGLYTFADRSLMHHIILLAAHDAQPGSGRPVVQPGSSGTGSMMAPATGHTIAAGA
ncbi:MAG TPA: ATP-binding protein [Acetobacteraceae bacterium]